MTQRVPFIRGLDYERIPGSWWCSRWKWHLLGTHECHTRIYPAFRLHMEYVSIYPDGTLVLEGGYAIDGVTFGWDSPRSMRAAYIHDGLCQLIESGWLGWEWRRQADREFLRALIDDGFPPCWARLRYRAVRAWSCMAEARVKC